MSFVEKIQVKCDKCEGFAAWTFGDRMYFRNHSEAIKHAELEGWRLTSYGDTCKTCLEKEVVPKETPAQVVGDRVDQSTESVG